MRLTSLMVVFAAALIAGCAGHSAECVTGTGQTDCAPGTEGYRRMQIQQQDTKTTAEIDDALCRSYGAQPGSAAYAECRRKRAGDRRSSTAPGVSEPLPKSN